MLILYRDSNGMIHYAEAREITIYKGRVWDKWYVAAVMEDRVEDIAPAFDTIEAAEAALLTFVADARHLERGDIREITRIYKALKNKEEK